MPDPVESVEPSMVGATFHPLSAESGEPGGPAQQDAANEASGFAGEEERPGPVVLEAKPDGTALIASAEYLMGFAVRSAARKRKLAGPEIEALCSFDKEERAILGMVAPGAEEFLGVSELTPQQAAIVFGAALAFVAFSRVYSVSLMHTPTERKAKDKAAAQAKTDHEVRWGGSPPSTLEVGYVPETVGFPPRRNTAPEGGVPWSPERP